MDILKAEIEQTKIKNDQLVIDKSEITPNNSSIKRLITNESRRRSYNIISKPEPRRNSSIRSKSSSKIDKVEYIEISRTNKLFRFKPKYFILI